LRGRAFGFNKAMDKTGGFLGLLVAAGVLYLTQRDTVILTRESYEWLVLLAVLPGLAAVGIVAWYVEEPAVTSTGKALPALVWSDMDRRFWLFILVLVVFTLGNSSDAFLMLRAQTVGFSTIEIFLVVAAFSLVIAVTSTKGGILSDKLGRRGLIIAGWLISGTCGLFTPAMAFTTVRFSEPPGPWSLTWFPDTCAARPTEYSMPLWAWQRCRQA
jgi:MFS family permease